jgi:predicted nucleic acid-binding protein
MLTDTTFWIDLLRERQLAQMAAANAFLARHRTEPLSISVVTWGELAVGVEHSRDLEQILRRINIHFLPLQVAWQASRIDRELALTGERLGENDNWIAATALTYGLRLVTRDEGFRRVPRLRVLTY